jgi:hypothetical protein
MLPTLPPSGEGAAAAERPEDGGCSTSELAATRGLGLAWPQRVGLVVLAELFDWSQSTSALFGEA